MASSGLFVVITTDIGRYIRQDRAGEGGQGRHGRTRTPANAQPIIFTFLQEAPSCVRDNKARPTPRLLKRAREHTERFDSLMLIEAPSFRLSGAGATRWVEPGGPPREIWGMPFASMLPPKPALAAQVPR